MKTFGQVVSYGEAAKKARALPGLRIHGDVRRYYSLTLSTVYTKLSAR